MISDEILYAAKLKPNERLDDLEFRGRVIIQNKREFCFGIDAVLLAHFPRYLRKWRVLELGTGSGVIPLLMCDKVSAVDAIELNSILADIARRNVVLNHLAERIFIHEGDYRFLPPQFTPHSFDLVLSNPPYFALGSGTLSQTAGKAGARHELTATLADTCRTARLALKQGGRFALIHVTERLGEIACALHAHDLEMKRLQFIQPHIDEAPNLMLVEAAAGAAAGGLRMLPPLIVREKNGDYTRAVDIIYGRINGEGELS